ncbi:MAG TPA: maleylpyruvate isomerase N-terminal domain-containing protein [Candidatus Dormibacteraeota bacterium]|nr:maleylpyruvate isomerase N-terminal domain-containing protein [Candidatus Dormibacteraeota bacterium]
MAIEREDLLKHYRESRSKMLAALDGLTDEQMSEASIDGWAVKDHLAHLALWDDIRAAEVERISAGHESVWKMTEHQDEDHNAVGFELRKSISAGQARWELEHSRRRLLDAITAAKPEALDPARYGAAGLRSQHEDQHSGWIARWRGDKGY